MTNFDSNPGTSTSRPRRDFLGQMGTGMLGVAMAHLLGRESRAAEDSKSPPRGQPHFAPRARLDYDFGDH